MFGTLFIAVAALISPIDEAIEAYQAEDAALVEQLEQLDPEDRIAILEVRADRDQLVRSTLRGLATDRELVNSNPIAIAQLAGSMRLLDVENTNWLKADLADNGWVTVSEYGEDAAEDAFLILQHATHDVEFMASMVESFDAMRQTGDVDPGHYALLYDRVATLSGGQQRYGTQWACANGNRMQMSGIEDEANVDARRAEVGLEPMAVALENLGC